MRWARPVAAALVGACAGILCGAVAASSPPASWGLMLYGAPIGGTIGAAVGLVLWVLMRAMFHWGGRIAPALGWIASSGFAAAASAAVVSVALAGLEANTVMATATAMAVIAASGSVVENLSAGRQERTARIA
ncbi:hypothetical protein [Labedella gwakjiensis]|nr:hypothetical protein [Labedella gwakjiensis]